MLDLLTEKELEQIQQKGSDFMGKPTNEYGTPIGGQFNQNRGFAQNEVSVVEGAFIVYSSSLIYYLYLS